MDIQTILQITAAVIAGNAVSALFIFAMVTAWRLQSKEHLGDSELPLWIYPCGILAPAIIAIGAYFIPVG